MSISWASWLSTKLQTFSPPQQGALLCGAARPALSYLAPADPCCKPPKCLEAKTGISPPRFSLALPNGIFRSDFGSLSVENTDGQGSLFPRPSWKIRDTPQTVAAYLCYYRLAGAICRASFSARRWCRETRKGNVKRQTSQWSYLVNSFDNMSSLATSQGMLWANKNKTHSASRCVGACFHLSHLKIWNSNQFASAPCKRALSARGRWSGHSGATLTASIDMNK